MDFTAEGALAASAPTWSRTFLQPLAPGALTPFSQSILAEIVGRAWLRYYDRLDFSPPRARVLRSYQGRPYMNLTLGAELEAQRAGLEPPAYVIDGQARPVCAWEKPGLFAAMKLGRGARKIAETAAAMENELGELDGKAQSWLQRVAGLRWSQAEILQIMEEIENAGAPGMAVFLAARQRLESTSAHFLSQARAAGHPQPDALLAQVLAAAPGLVEAEIARQVAALGAAAQQEPAAHAFLAAGDYAQWASALPGAFAEQVRAFLTAYGHRGAGEGELSNPRWAEDPSPLFQAILAAGRRGGAPPRPADVNALLAGVDGKQRKALTELAETLHAAMRLQSQALHICARILAGARRWALAAGHEAAADQRLAAETDVFYYELEEVKQMMTGEWNISDQTGIRATAAARKEQMAAAQQQQPAELLVGDVAVRRTGAGLPGAPGVAAGRIGAEVRVARQLDAGWSLWLPAAAALITAQGSPLDPISAAAGALGTPLVIDADAAPTLAEGAVVTVEGDRGQVRAGQAG